MRCCAARSCGREARTALLAKAPNRLHASQLRCETKADLGDIQICREQSSDNGSDLPRAIRIPPPALVTEDRGASDKPVKAIGIEEAMAAVLDGTA